MKLALIIGGLILVGYIYFTRTPTVGGVVNSITNTADINSENALADALANLNLAVYNSEHPASASIVQLQPAGYSSYRTYQPLPGVTP